MGRGPRLAPLPPWIIEGAAEVAHAGARLRGVPVIFTPGKARELLHPDWSVDEAEYPPGGATAARSLDDGFASTVAWYRARGWLPAGGRDKK
jgi:hypothetical protein